MRNEGFVQNCRDAVMRAGDGSLASHSESIAGLLDAHEEYLREVKRFQAPRVANMTNFWAVPRSSRAFTSVRCCVCALLVHGGRGRRRQRSVSRGGKIVSPAVTSLVSPTSEISLQRHFLSISR